MLEGGAGLRQQTTKHGGGLGEAAPRGPPLRGHVACNRHVTVLKHGERSAWNGVAGILLASERRAAWICAVCRESAPQAKEKMGLGAVLVRVASLDGGRGRSQRQDQGPWGGYWTPPHGPPRQTKEHGGGAQPEGGRQFKVSAL